ncbi:neurogenic locus notch homolog protein 1-like [Daphnia pulex]|uniref:neurogenic locus notch homolog protein 1-like n=1 Tax=Daphnia pulex TaxID=6669 RepID=UPI001EDFEB50|nr:neurogenic locus notch homolog protein 1-like [Daphnia pulex]
MNLTKCLVTLFSFILVLPLYAAPQGEPEESDELVDYGEYQQDERPKGENYVLQYVGPRQKAERLFKVMALSKGTSRGVSQSDEQNLKMNQTQGLSKDNGNAFFNLSDEGSAVVSTELKTPRNKSALISFKGGCMEKPPKPANTANMKCAPNNGHCDVKCVKNFFFPDKLKQLRIHCEAPGIWKVGDSEKIPDCEPICMPPCQNFGFCSAPDICTCSENFEGPQCQFAKDNLCHDKPPTSMNSQVVCNGTSECISTCNKGFAFASGNTELKWTCDSGRWVHCQQQTGKFPKVPDCLSACDPPCENGGRCLANNVCECPQGFRGPQCNYPVENCAPERMGFNGVYNCSCGSSSLSCCVLCSLNCGTDGVFEFPPAPVYSCEYAEAKFFPETVPQCIFENQQQEQPVQSFKSNSTSHSQMVITQTSNMEWTGKETSNQETDFSVVSNGFQGFLGFIPKNRILNSEKDNYKATRDLLGKSMPSRFNYGSNLYQKKYHYNKSAPPYKN